MHTFIYPIKDTYINNSKYFIEKNFGIDEILEIYALNNGSRLEYTSTNWHDVPLTSSTYGNEGWLAVDDSYFYVYANGAWRRFAIASADVPYPISIDNFTGRFTNITTDPKKSLYLSGSSKNISGSFSGSYRSTSNVLVSGSFTTGSFNGVLYKSSSFTTLKVNGNVYTNSPLTSSLSGVGIFKKLNGKIFGKSYVSPQPYCLLGTFTGSISGSNFNGFISSSTSTKYYYADVTNFSGYFQGHYTGSINPPEKVCYLIKPEFSRTLLHFDLEHISSSISRNEISSSNIKFTLNLVACGQRNLPFDYTIYAYPISQSWSNGDGRYADNGSDLGVSWKYRNYINNGKWIEPMTGSYKKVDYLLSSSYAEEAFQNGGGTWYYDVPSQYSNKDHWICSSSAFSPLSGSDLICSQNFSLGQQGDISIDITKIVRSWLCGCVPNNGIVLITSLETTIPPIGKTNGLLQFFSRETNTIYSPYIDIAWKDSVYNTGNLKPVTGSIENLITLNQLKESYKAGSMPKVFVFARDRYFLKQFSKGYQQPSMVTPKYLPSSSYFMIKDAESNQVLIDFDEYSKLSCDPIRGNYFKFDTTGLPQERYFKIFIKSEYPDGVVDITDTEKIFKIVR